MSRVDIQKKIADVLGVSNSEKEMAFEIFISKVAENLVENLSLKVPHVGFFQLRKNKNSDDKPDSIIFSPLLEDVTQDAKNFYVTIDFPQHLRTKDEFDSTVFSIGVGKPLLPISEGSQISSDTETSYAILKKSIEERVNEIIAESDQLPNFNIWDDHYESLSPEKISPVDFGQIKLSELTSDLEFKDDLIAEDITYNLLDLELQKGISSKEKSEIGEESITELSPSGLLEDYSPKVKKSVSEKISPSDEIEVRLGKYKKDKDDNIDDIKNIPREENNIEDESVIEEIESVLSINGENIVRDKEVVDKEEKTYLWLKKKKVDEKISWNWGDELREEFGTGFTQDNKPNYDFVEEEEEPEPKIILPKEMFKKTKISAPNFFEKLDSSIKKEIEESDRDLQFMEYSGSPSRYEFIEDEKKEDYFDKNYSEPESYSEPSKLTLEEEIYARFRKDNENKYFSKNFLIISSAFLVVSVIIIYLLFPKKLVDQTKPTQSVVQPADTQQIVGSLSVDTQKTILYEGENDFPRVASLPITDKNKAQSRNQNLLVTPPKINSSPNDLYRTLTTDTRIGKSVYYDGSSYNVQVSSWRNKLKAEQEIKRLRGQDISAFLVEVYLPQKGGTWYRIRIGPFKTSEAAEQFLVKNTFEK